MQVKSEEHKSAILILATDEHGAIPLIDGALRDYKQGVGSSWCEAPRWPGRAFYATPREWGHGFLGFVESFPGPWAWFLNSWA